MSKIDISKIPRNTTLLLMPMTEESFDIEKAIPKNISNMNEAFLQFRPTKSVSIEDEYGHVVSNKCELRFSTIDDFSIEGIVAKIPYLTALKEYEAALRQVAEGFTFIRGLRLILSDSIERQYFIETLDILINELKTKTLDNQKTLTLKNNCDRFEVYGGFFDIVTDIFTDEDNIYKLDPNFSHRNIFLGEVNDVDRKTLRYKLEVLQEVMSDNKNNPITTCSELISTIKKTYKVNLKNILKEIRNIEKSYRLLDLFFKNAQYDKIENVSVLNVPFRESVTDDFSSEISDIHYEILNKYFNDRYDRFSLTDNYSLLVIPGHLNVDLQKWAAMLYKYRIMLITDFSNETEYESLLYKIDDRKITGGKSELSTIIMTCNWGVCRGRYEGIEEQDMLLPMSVALAGRMYSGKSIQPAAGYKHGYLSGVKGTQLDLLRSQIIELDRKGVIPIITDNRNGLVCAMSDTTLCIESSDPDEKASEVVRTKSWIAKILITYFNERTFEQFTAKIREEIKKDLNDFFGSIKGYESENMHLKSFNVEYPQQDFSNPQRVNLVVKIQPYFASRKHQIDLVFDEGKCSTEYK